MTTGHGTQDPLAAGEPLGVLAGLAEALAQAEDRVAELRAARDEAVRRCRGLGHSIPKVAAAAGVSGTTVKSILR